MDQIPDKVQFVRITPMYPAGIPWLIAKAFGWLDAFAKIRSLDHSNLMLTSQLQELSLITAGFACFISDLLEFIKVRDPDVILFPYADTWVPIIVKKARRYGLEPTFSRNGSFKSMASKSYCSYGKVNHKDDALIPDGRVLIDTAKSSIYTERAGLKGVIMASRLSGLSPNLTSRFTPGWF